MKTTKITSCIAILLSLALVIFLIAKKPSAGIENLRCEYSANPECIDATAPRLSWEMTSRQRGDVQTAYRILVASSPELLRKDEGDVWDSGKVDSDRTAGIEYSGMPLESAKDYWWKVMIWNGQGKASRWSAPAVWSMGLLEEKDWQGASWIAFKDSETWKSEWEAQKERERETASFDAAPGGSWPWFNWKDSTVFAISEQTEYDPAPLFRKPFKANGKVAKADLYICGLGYYIPYINGRRVGDRELNPAWTNFDQRSFYDRYDVTSMIEEDNVVGVMLGRGQYNPLCNDIWRLNVSSWVDQPKLIALLKLEYADGSVENITTDSSWKTIGGPVVYDDTRHGELYDAREEKDGWNAPGYSDTGWKNASMVEYSTSLRAQAMPPVRKFAPVQPIKTVDSMNGSKIYDIGKQIAGWARVKVKGPSGTKVLVEYCEMPSVEELSPNLPPSFYNYRKDDAYYASFYDKGLNIRQQNGYIMRGKGEETFECMFSYKGFRYIRVWTEGEGEVLEVEGIPVHTDFESNGGFTCSDETVNILQQNAINSMFSNFESIPTDCPHREKQGWTCDTYIVSKASMYNFNMALFYEKWVKDLALSETPQGGSVTVAPSTGYDGNLSTTWPAALVYVPDDMLNFYDDTKIISDNLTSMETLAASSVRHRQDGDKTDIINDVLGDWIAPHPSLDDSKPRQNDMAPPEGLSFYGTSAHFRIHKLIAKLSGTLGMSEKASCYKKRADEIAGHFNDEFFDASSVNYHGSNPTGYRQSTNATALYYGLVPEEYRKAVEDRLVEEIKANNSHLGTGFLGIQALMGCMPDLNPELTWQMVTQPTYPSWGYMVAQGATSMWETWDGYDSQNHLPFCMVSEYFYKHLAGIQYDEAAPGFKHMFIHPSFISSLEHVNCHYDSIHGRIESNWKRTKKGLVLEISIPANTSATVILPEGASDIKESGKAVDKSLKGIISSEGNRIEIGSGDYCFTFSE